MRIGGGDRPLLGGRGGDGGVGWCGATRGAGGPPRSEAGGTGPSLEGRIEEGGPRSGSTGPTCRGTIHLPLRRRLVCAPGCGFWNGIWSARRGKTEKRKDQRWCQSDCLLCECYVLMHDEMQLFKHTCLCLTCVDFSRKGWHLKI